MNLNNVLLLFFILKQHFETVIDAFNTFRWHLSVIWSHFLSRLQLVQNAAPQVLGQHITPTLASLHWFRLQFRVHFRNLLFAVKSLNGPPRLSELFSPNQSPGVNQVR